MNQDDVFQITLELTQAQLQMIDDALEVINPNDPDTINNVLIPVRTKIRKILARIERHEALFRQFQRLH